MGGRFIEVFAKFPALSKAGRLFLAASFGELAALI
jgi:hypothetical protein